MELAARLKPRISWPPVSEVIHLHPETGSIWLPVAGRLAESRGCENKEGEREGGGGRGENRHDGIFFGQGVLRQCRAESSQD